MTAAVLSILLSLALQAGPHRVEGTVAGAELRGVAAWTYGAADVPRCAALSASWACDVDGPTLIQLFYAPAPDACAPPTGRYTVDGGPPVPLALPGAAARSCLYLPRVNI